MRHRRHTQSGDDEAQIDLTPMLDVIFIMLIFFIVTTSFVKEAGIEVNPPKAETAKKQQRNNILIAISPAGEIWIDRKQVDVRAVRGAVERLRAENPEAAVVIQSDKEARTGVLVQVMDQVRLAGVERVAVAAQSE